LSANMNMNTNIVPLTQFSDATVVGDAMATVNP
jgi:hypothetical protein